MALTFLSYLMHNKKNLHILLPNLISRVSPAVGWRCSYTLKPNLEYINQFVLNPKNEPKPHLRLKP
jgi:hypothetical protein